MNLTRSKRKTLIIKSRRALIMRTLRSLRMNSCLRAIKGCRTIKSRWTKCSRLNVHRPMSHIRNQKSHWNNAWTRALMIDWSMMRSPENCKANSMATSTSPSSSWTQCIEKTLWRSTSECQFSAQRSPMLSSTQCVTSNQTSCTWDAKCRKFLSTSGTTG